MTVETLAPLTWTIIYIVGKIFFLLSFASLIVGFILLFKPEQLDQWNRKLANSPYSFRRATKPLEILRDIEPIIYRNKILLGVPFMLGAAYMTFFFAISLEVKPLVHIFASTPFEIFFTEIFFETSRIFFAISGVFAFAICFIFIFLHDTFEKVAKLFGSWVSTRKAMMPVQKMIFAEGTVIFKNHKIFGAALIVGSLYIIWGLYGLEHF